MRPSSRAIVRQISSRRKKLIYIFVEIRKSFNHNFVPALSSQLEYSLIACAATKFATAIPYSYYLYDPIALSLMQVATWSPPSVERGGVRAEAVSARAARAIEFQKQLVNTFAEMRLAA